MYTFSNDETEIAKFNELLFTVSMYFLSHALINGSVPVSSNVAAPTVNYSNINVPAVIQHLSQKVFFPHVTC